MIRRTGTAVLACTLQLLACGDDDGGAQVSSGLPKDEKLSSLDSGDAERLCKSLAKSFDGVLSDSDKKRISCTVLALPFSLKASSDGKLTGDVSKCKDLVSRCESGEKISDDEPAIDVDQTFIDESSCADAQDENFSSCEASVGDFEKCADAVLDALSGKFDIISCDSLSDPEKLTSTMSDDDVAIDKQPACKPLNSKCPEIDFGSSDSSEDSSNP